jgi:hypothetical protein
MSDTKKCTKCGVEKPATLEFYNRDKRSKSGIRSKCKECRKLYRENNKEKIKERGKLYYENNKEEIKEKNKLYRENNKEKISEQKKLYYENNKEEILEQKKLDYENNKEKFKERGKLYYENNKEKIIEREKLRYENNKEKILEQKKLRYENNKEKFKERDRLRYENNKEEILEQKRLLRENNKQNNPYGIYKITNKETGKIYIGETINFNGRFSRHKKTLKGQSHGNHLLQEAFDNGGQDFDEIFEFEILEEWDIERKQEFDLEKKTKCPKYKLLKEELRKREAEVIEEYIRQGHDLYNIVIDVETYAALMAEMREYLEAADET